MKWSTHLDKTVLVRALEMLIISGFRYQLNTTEPQLQICELYLNKIWTPQIKDTVKAKILEPKKGRHHEAWVPPSEFIFVCKDLFLHFEI